MSGRVPLEGLKVLVTRSRDQSSKLAEKLEELGAIPITVPVIRICPPESWAALDAALRDIETYDWIIFASTNAVSACLERLNALGRAAESLSKTRIAAIGPATGKALATAGISADFQPSGYVGEKLVEEFPGYPKLSGKSILWPRTNVGRKYVIEELSKAGASITAVEAYRTVEPENPEAIADLLANLVTKEPVDAITLASSQTARNLGRLLKMGIDRLDKPKKNVSETLEMSLQNIIVATIGPETSKTAKEILGKVDIEASQYTIDGLVNALTEKIQDRLNRDNRDT